MRLQMALRGRLSEHMTRELSVLERGVTLAVRRETEALKIGARKQVESAGLGKRLAGTIQDEVYPRGKPSLDAAGLVYTKAPNILESHETGALIRASKGQFLAIPTPEAGRTGRDAKGSRARLTPDTWERRTGLKLRFVPRRGGPSLLVADNVLPGVANKRNGVRIAYANRRKTKDGGVASRLYGRATVVIFVLLKQAKMKDRLDLKELGEDHIAKLPAAVVRAIEEVDRATPPVGGA